MNKRGLLGAIFWIAVIIILVTGTTMIFDFSKDGFQVKTGDVVLDINYNLSKNTPQEILPPENNETNSSVGGKDYDDSITISDITSNNSAPDLEFQQLSEN